MRKKLIFINKSRAACMAMRIGVGVCLMLLGMKTHAQYPLYTKSKWIDSINILLNDTLIKKLKPERQIDSLSYQKRPLIPRLTDNFHLDTLKPFSSLKKPKVPQPLLRFEGGTVRYDLNYRSTIDTPFLESNISQHLVTGSLNATLAQNFPITVTYFERQSNSKIFRDFRDVSISFNAPEFQRLQSKKANEYFSTFTDKIHDTALASSLKYSSTQVLRFDEWLNQKEVLNQLLEARTQLADTFSVDTSLYNRDSVLQQARNFITLYDAVKGKAKLLASYRDSLRKQYNETESLIANLQRVFKGNLDDHEAVEKLESLLKSKGFDTWPLQKSMRGVGAVRTFSIGKSIPNYSDLTLKNINVNGINFEYNRKMYFAFTAGAIAFRARDFIYNRTKRRPQFVYAGRIGYGLKEGSHVFFTAFKGKKQLLNTTTNPVALEIYGMSFESQVLLSRHHRLTVEVAQSASPTMIPTSGTAPKSFFKLSDEKNKAYSARLKSYFPATQTKFDFSYQYRGINYQSFSNYYSNAMTTTWQVRGEQYLWKRTLQIRAAASKNSFENPFVPVRYNGNTVFKNFNLTFRKNKWPVLSFGYQPSSQLSAFNGQVYETYYHALSLNTFHRYPLGAAKAFSTFTINRFYNDQQDSALTYFNAQNFFWNQTIQFNDYTALVNVSKTSNSQYKHTVLEAGFNSKLSNRFQIGFGIKVNKLNMQPIRTGFYGNGSISVPKVGDLNTWIEKSYLPSSSGMLFKTEIYNVGFTRYFK